MKKFLASLLTLALLLTALSGCAAPQQTPAETPPETEKELSSVVFEGDALYAVAYLGYNENGELAAYADKYLGGAETPVHYISGGEYYLVIPRYADMAMTLAANDMESGTPDLRYETPAAAPFVLRCNVSDIFADAAVTFTRGSDTATFTPFVSLMDGSVDVGTRGQNITE